MQKALCIIGLSGSGKTTLAKSMARRLGWSLVSTGDMVRTEAKLDTSLGQRCRQILEEGTFLTAEEIATFNMKAIEVHRESSGIIFEGSPRSGGEARLLNRELDCMFVLVDTPEDVCLMRLIGRGRSDDTVDNILSRFAEFKKALPDIDEVVDLRVICGTLRISNAVSLLTDALELHFETSTPSR